MVLFVGMPTAAIAAPPPSYSLTQTSALTPVQALEQLFQGRAVQANWFAPQFLRQIPLQQIEFILTDISQSMGALQAVTPVAEGYQLTFERGSVPTQVQLNPDGQITLLFFGPPELPLSLEEVVQMVQTFPGEASLLVMQGDSVLAEVNADQSLAVGSAFKLAILWALREAIAQGRFNWDTVVTLQSEWQSLPSGILQDWPTETALTLETLATLMIAVSDNTATDALIHTLGREAITAISPQNQPFLTTREFFALKNPENASILQTFREAEDGDEAWLDALTKAPLPGADLFLGAPIALDVEWFFSTRELCSLMAQVKDLPLMGVNPGLANPRSWQSVAFKGGSEPGVLNFTTALSTPEGDTYCVAATWNDATQPLDEIALSRLYNSIMVGLQPRSQ
ncbi:MAG: serine hydrolase [Cyanobacteria bacterium P01_H01_bin.58]